MNENPHLLQVDYSSNAHCITKFSKLHTSYWKEGVLYKKDGVACRKF